MRGREAERNLGEGRKTEETKRCRFNKFPDRELDGRDVSEEFEGVGGGGLEGT